MIDKNFLDNHKPPLKKLQKKALNLMIKGKNVFITGPGGVGKSAIIKIFRKIARPYKNVVVTSTTGTSAIQLQGTTLHSYLGIGFGRSSVESMTEKIMGWGWLKKRWRELECLIIDEISMLSPELFDKLETVAQLVRGNDLPFGGIQLILSGDFLQLPCVGIDGFCFQSKSWKKCIKDIIYLDEIIRQDDVQLQNFLNNFRIGKITEKDRELLDSRVGVELSNPIGIKPTKLFSKNCDVNRVNELELDNLANSGAEFYEYSSEYVLYSRNKNVIEKFKKNSNMIDCLQLCKGAQVMLIVNLDLESGLANGSRGVVSGFTSDDLPIVKFLNGKESIIENYTWEIKENDVKILNVTQLPLKVAYAISIHKSQGASLDYAEIDLESVFEYGQAYVGLSRIKTIEGLSIKSIDYDRIVAHPDAVEFYSQI